MADYATLGHFLPYLLRRRLQAVLWPESGKARAGALMALAILGAYGAGFGFFLNHADAAGTEYALPKVLVGVNAGLLASALLVDFFPALRVIRRPLPEHFPVTARQNVLTAFLLDLITLRRLMLLLGLLVTLAVAPQHAVVPVFSLLLVLGAAVLSFNLRLLLALQRWRHPLLVMHAANLGLMGWWLAHPGAPYYTALGVGMALLPWALWAAQQVVLAPYFSSRFLPAHAESTASSPLGRLPVEWKVYVRKTWLPLLLGAVLKTVLVGATGLLFLKNGKINNTNFFYLAFLPVIGFTYANNNLFGFMGPLVANELQRLGLTKRLPRLYLRLVGPVVVADCLLSTLLVLALFPASYWHLLGLLPVGAVALGSLGLWSSLYKAKPVAASIDFANMRNNSSQLVSLLAIGLAAALYFSPWWVGLMLAGALLASTWWPLRMVLRNDGELRRRLWRSIHASLN